MLSQRQSLSGQDVQEASAVLDRQQMTSARTDPRTRAEPAIELHDDEPVEHEPGLGGGGLPKVVERIEVVERLEISPGSLPA